MFKKITTNSKELHLCRTVPIITEYSGNVGMISEGDSVVINILEKRNMFYYDINTGKEYWTLLDFDGCFGEVGIVMHDIGEIEELKSLPNFSKLYLYQISAKDSEQNLYDFLKILEVGFFNRSNPTVKLQDNDLTITGLKKLARLSTVLKKGHIEFN